MEARLTDIDLAEAGRYLGCRGGGPGGDWDRVLAGCAGLVRETARPRAVWRRFRLLPDGSLEGAGCRLAGKDAARLLEGCSEALLMAATLGAEIDALLRRWQTKDMARAMALDACASAAIENVCDNLCADLARELAPLCLTGRFSPGYGDLPLAQQRDFFRLLDIPRRIGVSLTPGWLMLPQKSVTALLGVSDTPRHAGRSGCGGCPLNGACAFQKEGRFCGKP